MGNKPFHAQISVQKNSSKKSIMLEFYRKIQTDSAMHKSQKSINNFKKSVNVDIKQNKSSS